MLYFPSENTTNATVELPVDCMYVTGLDFYRRSIRKYNTELFLHIVDSVWSISGIVRETSTISCFAKQQDRKLPEGATTRITYSEVVYSPMIIKIHKLNCGISSTNLGIVKQLFLNRFILTKQKLKIYIFVSASIFDVRHCGSS